MTARKPGCGSLIGMPSDFAAITGALTLLSTIVDFLLVFLFPESVFSVIFSAVKGAVIVVVIVVVMWWQRCGQTGGRADCAAGVVNRITNSFSNWWEIVIPFSGMHDRVDLVTKCAFWPLVETGALTVHCTSHSDPLDQSPVLQCFYYNPRVCQVAVGSIVGALIGAVLGIYFGVALGLLAAAAVVVIAGCSTLVACIPALIVAVIVAFLAAALITLVVAIVAGLIVLAATSAQSPGPTIADGTPGGTAINVGDYLTVPGNYLLHEQFDNSIVAWFADPASTAQHGSSLDPGPPFVHRDPDANLVVDACPARVREA